MEASKTGNKKRKADIIILSLSVLALFFILLFSSLYSSIEENYFSYSFERYGVYDIFDKQDADIKSAEIVDFLKGSEKNRLEFLKEDEISHLIDVRNILSIIRIIYFASLTLFIFLLLLNWKQALKSSGIVLILILLLVSLYYIIGFSYAFEFFHKLFFAGNYAFDPNVSIMKALYPDELFMWFSQIIFFKFLTKTLLVFLLSKTLLRSLN